MAGFAVKPEAFFEGRRGLGDLAKGFAECVDEIDRRRCEIGCISAFIGLHYG